ncbi:MAG: helicase-exonuclease AddAB subunit AddA [Lachnospiraceae bacterium]|nr:helicase-exonuclease AddAB subunit AddA [Lachnospiraceae bacterium]
MAMNFTPDQQRVIDTRNSNILVSAAAGSGKTAVLVERIIQMITDDSHPVDIDRLLIVTFTSAAAAQMRERISKAVSKKLEENPENEHLQKQASLIHNALITTIDSFCLFVIRNNFNEIGLDPGFRVADESEVKMLEADVMDKLLEEAHTEPTERFLRFVECYSTGASEKKIEEAILRLYHFSMSYPFPEEWLNERLEDYRLKDVSELSHKRWFQGALAYVNTILQECLDRLHQALGIAGSVGGPIQYADNLASDIELMEKLKSASDYNELYGLFTYSSFTRLSTKKAEGVDPVLKDMVKAIRDEVKKSIADLKKFLFQISAEDTLNDMAVCQEVVSELVSLTLSFKEKLDQSKRDKNIIDFSDMEHFALQILLRKDENGNIIPQNTALELQDYFVEIMIDEYQDSNEVQELLLKCISGEDKGHFNRFMVGDVKQSIYKFRLARPEIFMEKYDTYVINSSDSKKTRIDLSVNFRSRREVTDATNFICSQIMTAKVGNVEYDDKAALYVGASYPEAGERYDRDIYCTELMIATPDSLIDENTSDSDVINGVPDASSKYSEKEIEAVMVADRIRQLVGSFPVTDAATGEMRPAKYSDIVLLFRATSGWDEDFRRILSERGIPVHVTSKTGYFETIEIQGIVNLLRVLDNPLQDIPLFGVLKLAYFDFSEEDITRIRCFAKEYLDRKAQLENRTAKKLFLYEQIKLYYDSVHLCSEEDADEVLQDMIQEKQIREKVSRRKLERFFATIAQYREKIAYTPIKELLQQLIATTGYEAYVGSMPGGDQRRANIAILLEKAGAFQNTSFYGLFHFIRYLETMQEQEVDFGEANILDENADVVRIMTIHKSKGLEFPICFVCGLSKQFNQMDMRQGIIMDVELGVGVDFIEPTLRYRRKTMRKNVVAQRMKEDTRGEDLRVLYVALTRAKEKLILTGFVNDIDKKISNNIALTMESSGKLPYSVIMNAASYMDLLFASLIRHDCMKEILEERGFEYIVHSLPYREIPIRFELYKEADSLSQKLAKQLQEQGKALSLEDELGRSSLLADETLAKKLQERLHFVYPNSNLAGLTVKTTVSELKKASYEEAVEESAELVVLPKESYVPKFILEEENMTEVSDSENAGRATMPGTQYGTVVHKMMELLSFSAKYRVDNMDDERSAKRIYAMIKGEQEQWVSEGRMTKDELSCVGTNKLMGFFRSSLSQRMTAAAERNELFKEQPFVLGISADQLNPDYPSTETVLIQGVIDVFFYEDGEIVLADYKTDRVSCAQELADRYRTQLDYYQMALEQITGKKVKERYLYSFYLQEEIDV